MEAKLGLTGLTVIVIMDMVTLMDIIIMMGMIDVITVIKITAIISIRIIIIKILEVTIKIPITHMIVATGRTKNSSGNITSIIIRRIMQITGNSNQNANRGNSYNNSQSSGSAAHVSDYEKH